MRLKLLLWKVKDREQARVRYITQALGYSTFAHRCYLAMPVKYKDEYVGYAKQMGVDLLEINGNDVIEVLTAELKNPNEIMLTWFLRRSLNLVKCVFCGSITHRFQAKRIKRTNVFRKEKHLYVCAECCNILKLTNE